MSAVGGHDADDLAPPPLSEQDGAVRQGEQRVVATAADQIARVELRPALPDEDLTGTDDLPAEALDAEPLGLGVATVARAGGTLFMSHRYAYFPVEMPVTL